ncbi:MAG: type I-F CRISPR-associated helicase Cas3 [Candidatus Competibacteraceae bacterium]|nr:type I-F CRISPR-associated helicase Cas3 [Candidatus Competibacteraceae bacterium]MCP5124898.1 type I-F CRISPR-associated helicase Cas3 [Gammaproteobacteria bacterium]
MPTNMTARDVLRADDENDWHTAEDIRLLARLAALFHDFGKANHAFQTKLTSKTPKADAYRHEWVSLRLFESFVRQCGTHDKDWLTRLTDLPETARESCIGGLSRDGLQNGRLAPPFRNLPPLAQIVGWLIVSHHRLPTPIADAQLNQRLLEKILDQIGADWCGSRPDETNAKDCWQFKNGLPFDSNHWRQHTAKVAQAILQRPRLSDQAQAAQWLGSPYVLHLSRMALMLADHHYSAQPSHTMYGDPPGKKGTALYANTGLQNGKRELKQRLDEHLIGVEVSASHIVRALPRLADTLPRIPPRHPKFRERSKEPFRWQNQAFDLAESVRERATRQGFFGVNMASTGCGKTLANGRILYALADPQHGARFTVALGLRTLTLQTGDAYRDRLHLGPEDLAVLVGGVATRDLHEYQLGEDEKARRNSGSESSAPLLPEFNYVHYEGSLENGPLKEWLGKNSDALRLLDAPVLACTIDHLMPATEGLRGGHQIAPMLRLMTSDLVLDEPDDFGIEDLPALSRLVHWAGLLGSRVLLSSATLPPALVQGLFLAYLAGRAEHQRNRGRLGEPLSVCCAWCDEFDAQASEHDDGAGYLHAHRRFVDQRLVRLAKVDVRRRAAIKPLPIAAGQSRDAICIELAGQMREHLHALHRQHHGTDLQTGKRVSFGLIRMANIDPLFDVARELFRLGAEANCRIHLCVYHSRHPMLVRAAIERELDTVLKRSDPEAVFQQPSIRQRLDNVPETDHIFVVLATAVAEVGRDHDHDWAIVEPSSMRSFIQLAGRVRRHRAWVCPENQPNLYLLDTNIRHLVGSANGLAFLRPGFESANFRLNSHRLTELLEPEQWQVINAAARIKERESPAPHDNLADLEHDRLRDLMLGADAGQVQRQRLVHRWWTTGAHLSGTLQRRDPFRNDPLGRSHYALLPDEDDRIDFYHLPEGSNPVPVGNLWLVMAEGDLPRGPGIEAWAVPRYLDALQELADVQGMELPDCALKYGTLELPFKSGSSRRELECWRYHWALGFSRYRG